ncbi:MAG: SRPBCC domain-containing protein, partial [Proteobacteria bacterium]|nr:SRPBCC domain-containing protein [Pseudomonadota bacterium]
RPHRLVFGYNMDREDKLTVVTVVTVATEDGCQLTLSHDMDPKWVHMIDQARAGWTTILEGLATVV